VSAAKIAHRTLRQDVNRDYTHRRFTALRESFADRRFLVAALALNFEIVPPVAFGLSQLAPAGQAVELGVLTVLLTPCIDYVIVLTRLGGRKRPKAVGGRAIADARSHSGLRFRNRLNGAAPAALTDQIGIAGRARPWVSLGWKR